MKKNEDTVWNINDNKITTPSRVEFTPITKKKEFQTMYEILKDAEKYDNANEKDVCISTLTILSEFIEKYKSKF